MASSERDRRAAITVLIVQVLTLLALFALQLAFTR